MAFWGIVSPVLLLWLTRIVFKKAIKKYESASS